MRPRTRKRTSKRGNYSKEPAYEGIFKDVKRYVHVSLSVYVVGRGYRENVVKDGAKWSEWAKGERKKVRKVERTEPIYHLPLIRTPRQISA